jgi:hypothetical protein
MGWLCESSERRGHEMQDANDGGRRRTKLTPQMKARCAALTMHARYPDAAKRNGRKGGVTTASKYKDGRKVWAVRMALKRWHGVPFEYQAQGEPGASSEPSTESMD